MANILLINSNPVHFIVLQQLITEKVEWERVESIEKACQILAQGKNIPALILVCSEDWDHLAQLCQQTTKISHQKIPVIVMIEEPAHRSLIFEQGADDFLLMPLRAIEVNTRLKYYLNAAEVARIQAEAQFTNEYTAWMLLLTAFMAEERSQENIFSQILQQIVHLAHTDGGEIWLFSEDGRSLYLAAALFNHPFPLRRPRSCALKEGWIGWAAEHAEPLIITDLSETLFPGLPPSFLEGLKHFSVLAINLHTKVKKLGVLAMYHKRPALFTPRDVKIFEKNAFLLSAQIANVQVMESLRQYAGQQRILYEMSQQISLGLDLRTTLNRAAQWLGRLSDVEISVIWLASEFGDCFEAVAVLGASLPETPLVIQNGDSILDATPVVLNDPAHEFYLPTIFSTLHIIPHNGLILPMHERGKKLGMATLFNKISGPFKQVEIRLLQAAIEMIAVSISNAKLFTQTITLIEEREHLHKQAIQTERLRTIGRLTASLAHEINNPMQAIRGALTLALEDLHNPEELLEYLTLSLQETERVVKLVNRMRQLYHPSTDQVEAISLVNLLREVFEISKDELNGRRVKANLILPLHSPVVYGIANQLHLAFLSIFLSLIESIGTAGGGNLSVSTQDLRSSVNVEFITSARIGFSLELDNKIESGQSEPSAQVEPIYGLSPVVELLSANNGKMDLLRQDGQTTLKVEFSKGVAF